MDYACWVSHKNGSYTHPWLCKTVFLKWSWHAALDLKSFDSKIHCPPSCTSMFPLVQTTNRQHPTMNPQSPSKQPQPTSFRPGRCHSQLQSSKNHQMTGTKRSLGTGDKLQVLMVWLMMMVSQWLFDCSWFSKWWYGSWWYSRWCLVNVVIPRKSLGLVPLDRFQIHGSWDFF